MARMQSPRGQSLIEVLIGVTVGAVIIGAAVTAIVSALKSNTDVSRVQVAQTIAKELLENVRVLGDADWHAIDGLGVGSGNHYHLVTNPSPFSVASGDESIAFATTTYTRYFYMENVNRNAAGNIVEGSGSNDPSTRKITVVAQWENAPPRTIVAYLARSRHKIFHQTDWSGGSGQDGPVTSTNSKFASSTKVHATGTPGSITIEF